MSPKTPSWAAISSAEPWWHSLVIWYLLLELIMLFPGLAFGGLWMTAFIAIFALPVAIILLAGAMSFIATLILMAIETFSSR